MVRYEKLAQVQEHYSTGDLSRRRKFDVTIELLRIAIDAFPINSITTSSAEACNYFRILKVYDAHKSHWIQFTLRLFLSDAFFRNINIANKTFMNNSITNLRWNETAHGFLLWLISAALTIFLLFILINDQRKKPDSSAEIYGELCAIHGFIPAMLSNGLHSWERHADNFLALFYGWGKRLTMPRLILSTKLYQILTSFAAKLLKSTKKN